MRPSNVCKVVTTRRLHHDRAIHQAPFLHNMFVICSISHALCPALSNCRIGPILFSREAQISMAAIVRSSRTSPLRRRIVSTSTTSREIKMRVWQDFWLKFWKKQGPAANAALPRRYAAMSSPARAAVESLSTTSRRRRPGYMPPMACQAEPPTFRHPNFLPAH